MLAERSLRTIRAAACARARGRALWRGAHLKRRGAPDEPARAAQDSIMATRGAQQALVPGRVVLVRHPASGLPELGAVCGAPAGAGAGRPAGPTAGSVAAGVAGAPRGARGSAGHSAPAMPACCSSGAAPCWAPGVSWRDGGYMLRGRAGVPSSGPRGGRCALPLLL